MAEVLAKGSFLSPRGGGGSQRSLWRRCERRKPAFVACRRGSTPEIGAFRSSVRNSAINGRRLVAGERKRKPLRAYRSLIPIMMSLYIGNSSKWWEKGLQPNMKTIESAQDLVGFLLSAGNKLVIVDFFSPGCGGCRALHPKICQLAEMDPDVLFLQVNYEKHKSMCYSLNVHVLPFFRFYRGSDGRLCSFSCTNATIKKFKDALAKNNTEMCSRGPAKGLEESELLALAANKDLSFNYTRKPALVPSHDDVVEIEAPASPRLPLPMATVLIQDSEDKALVAASGR